MEELRMGGLSDERVLERVEVLVERSNETTAELLAYLGEVDARGLHLGQACGSLFAYCVERLHMSEAAAGKRITAARTARRFPVVLDMIARGEIHLCGVTLLAAHLTGENHAELLGRARHMSKREIEKLVAEIAPRPDMPSRVVALPRPAGPTVEPASSTTREGAQEVQAPGRVQPAPVGPPAVVAPLAPRRYQIRVTVDEETHAALCQLQDLLSHQIPDRDPAAIISRALAHELERTLALRTRATARPRRPRVDTRAKAPATANGEAGVNGDGKAPGKRSRHVPAATCREVWQRDGGRCAFVDAKGRRCSSTRFLELHHIGNWARGADHDPAEMELRCRAHNQHQAVLDYGAAFMEAKKRAARSRAEAPRAEYRSARERSAGRRHVGGQAHAPAAESLGAHPRTSSGRGAGARHVPWTQSPSTQRPSAPNTGTHAATKGRPTAMGPCGSQASLSPRSHALVELVRDPEVQSRGAARVWRRQAAAPWHFLYFWPLPQGQGSLRPTLGVSRTTGLGLTMSPST